MTEQETLNNRKPVPIRQRPTSMLRRIDLPIRADVIDLEKEREKRRPSNFYRDGI